MASTFPGLTSVGSLVAPGSRVLDDKVAVSSSKLSSLASISSSSLGRRKNVALRKTRSSQITAASKELYFNKDGSAIKNSSFKGVVLQQGWLSHQETACVSVNKLADLVGVTLGPKEEMLYLKASMVLQKLPMMELLWLERSNWKIQLRTWELNWSDKQLPKLMTWQEMGQQHVLFLHKVSLLKVSR